VGKEKSEFVSPHWLHLVQPIKGFKRVATRSTGANALNNYTKKALQSFGPHRQVGPRVEAQKQKRNVGGEKGRSGNQKRENRNTFWQFHRDVGAM